MDNTAVMALVLTVYFIRFYLLPLNVALELLRSQCIEENMMSYMDSSAQRPRAHPWAGYAQLVLLPSSVLSHRAS